MAAGAARFRRAAGLAVAAAVLLWLGMRFEETLLYFPTRALAAAPEDHPYRLAAEDVRPRTEDGVELFGWWIRGEGKRAVLFFHGNAGNAADRLDRAKILHDRFGLDVFLVDYRGYGRSSGSPSEAGLERDARAIYEAATSRGFPPEGIVVFGESLGSAVAVGLAAERPCGGVILETPFLSIRAMARRHYPFVPGFLIRTRFDNGARIAAVRAPKLFLVAERDEIVPSAQGRRLFELAPPPKRLYEIPGAGHNDTYATGGEPYWEAIRSFLAALP
jgi:pimeloyl-ACP methyl ester carboxylesterase